MAIARPAVSHPVAHPSARPVIALDAMGGDHAPATVVSAALLVAEELDVEILLVGQEPVVKPLLGRAPSDSIQLVHAGEVVAMADDPATSVRKKKDSSVVRCAEAVRDGRAHAMVSAGNTGGAMASALLRMGRIKGVARPAVATMVPVLGSTPTVMLDGGATVDCAPEWLVQFAQMGAEVARVRLGIASPRIGLLSNGEEPGKGDQLRKAVTPLLLDLPGFIGNVEGRDIVSDRVDVVVTDGFTGNVALKAMEGAANMAIQMVWDVLDGAPADAAKALRPLFEEASATLDSEATGGAMLVGVDGVCIISHGSSSPRAIVNAVRVAIECHETGIVQRMKEVIGYAGRDPR